MRRSSGLASRAGRLIQASPIVPDQLLTTSPTGTFRAFWRSRPKKYATAENDGVVAGPLSSQTPFLVSPSRAPPLPSSQRLVQSSQTPFLVSRWRSDSGPLAALRGTLYNRSIGFADAAMSSW